MNYIFELMLSMIEQEKHRETLIFRKAAEYSAYMELALDCVNQKEFHEYDVVEINPYFRYHEIFKEFFTNEEYKELKQNLLDILIHINFETERLSGMTKRSFYQILIGEACQRGEFGVVVAQKWDVLTPAEEHIVTNALIESYTTGDVLGICKRTIHNFFPKGNVYFHHYQKEEILVYTAVVKNNTRVKKMELLIELFLPLQYEIQVYWKNHFGIIDVDETMLLDQVELY